MQRNFFHLILPLIVVALAVCLGCGPEPGIENQRLAEVGPFSVAVEWQTDTPHAFQVRYGEGSLLDQEAIEEEAATSHRVTLSGLKPATMYSYRIGSSGPSATFRSAPSSGGAFDMMVLDEASAFCKPGAQLPATAPDIIFYKKPCQGALAAKPESILTIPLEQENVRLKRGRWQVMNTEGLASKIDPAQSELQRIIVLSQSPGILQEPVKEAVFLWPQGASHGKTIIDWKNENTPVLEVDAFEVALRWENKEGATRRVLVPAPPETKKTCLYCDRLMESGRYEESIQWYRNFLGSNRERHEVEDAVYSIARILDEKLFRYQDAIREYEEFLKLYPGSRRAVLVRYRLDYLGTRSDNNFAPLARFEKAKAALVTTNPLPATKEVEAMLTAFPDCAVSEDALFWLGNLYQHVDTEKARSNYRELIQRFPEGENAALAAIALGDMLYQTKHYRAAVGAYDNAARIVPERYEISVAEKLRKSHRNIWRERGRYGAWAILAGWLLFSLIRRATPTRKDFLTVTFVAALVAIAGSIYFIFTYDQTGQTLPAVASLAAATGFLVLWNFGLIENGSAHGWVTLAHAATCSVSAIFLILYQFHFLFLLGL